MDTPPPEFRPRARTVMITEHELIVSLVDGRTLSVPIDWFPRLAQAGAQARAHWRLIGEGDGIHWPDLDEDLSVEALMSGVRARAER